jgi:hypothetical protein
MTAPTSSPPFDPPLILLADEIFTGRDEIVEHVLLALELTGAMPFLAVLSAPADVRDCVHAALLDPRDHVGMETRPLADGEAAVRVEHRRIRAVLRHVAPMRDEHRDARTVLALVEDALGREARGVEREPRRIERPARIRLGVVHEGRRGVER